jgi:hypothetical protein
MKSDTITIPNNKQTKTECSICLESVTENIHKLSCGHSFHRNCYNTWAQMSSRPTCPNCRAQSTDVIREDGTEQVEHVTNNILRSRAIMTPSYHGASYHNLSQHGIGSRDMSAGETIVMLIFMIMALGILSLATSISSSCMCRFKWEDGQTHMIERDFWGAQSVYTRPDMCRYVC